MQEKVSDIGWEKGQRGARRTARIDGSAAGAKWSVGRPGAYVTMPFAIKAAPPVARARVCAKIKRKTPGVGWGGRQTRDLEQIQVLRAAKIAPRPRDRERERDSLVQFWGLPADTRLLAAGARSIIHLRSPVCWLACGVGCIGGWACRICEKSFRGLVRDSDFGELNCIIVLINWKIFFQRDLIIILFLTERVDRKLNFLHFSAGIVRPPIIVHFL